jgi:hypothetical protein
MNTIRVDLRSRREAAKEQFFFFGQSSSADMYSRLEAPNTDRVSMENKETKKLECE